MPKPNVRDFFNSLIINYQPVVISFTEADQIAWSTGKDYTVYNNSSEQQIVLTEKFHWWESVTFKLQDDRVEFTTP
jgi:hypothetical protein